MAMDLKRLYQILNETTAQFRTGEVFEGTPSLVEQANQGEELKGGGVLEVYAMPHEREARSDVEKVDLEFLTIGVDRAAAESRKDELISILSAYPEPERLAGGPSYIEVGGILGDQGAAFQLFALGKVLGLWNVITPATVGITGPEARQLAGMGFVMMSGFRPEAEAA